jgi:hypothetical protein
MKRVRLFVYIITAGVLLFTSVWPPVSVSAAAEGYWQQENVEIQKSTEDATRTVQIGRGFASVREEVQASGDVFASSIVWTEPTDTYFAGDSVELTLDVSIDSYIWNGTPGDDSSSDLNYMGAHVNARIDEPGLLYGFVGASAVRLATEDDTRDAKVSAIGGKIIKSSDSINVSAVFAAGRKEGETRTIYISSDAGVIRYNYKWIAEPVKNTVDEPKTSENNTEKSEEKTIRISGIVENINHVVMPRMQLDISMYYNAEAWYANALADVSTTTTTDIEGRFKQDIKLPENIKTPVGIYIKGTLNCMLPGDNKSFYLTDVSNADTNNEITVSSYIIIDPADSAYEGSEIISIKRLLSFYFLCVDAWSFDKSSNPDILQTNEDDLYYLASASYLYRLAWDAQFFGAVLFNEADTLTENTVRIETRYSDRITHFDTSDITIRLNPEDSRYNDNSCFCILHEYGHYFDYVTNGGSLRAGAGWGSGDTNHGGYLNSSTADSFGEGFATTYAALVRRFRGEKAPHVLGCYDIGDAGAYVAWKNNGLDEELAIAALLYNMYPYFQDPKDYWAILDVDRTDFYAYYKAFENELNDNEEAVYQLNRYAEQGGLYQMPFGNGRYDLGEPFRDLPNEDGEKNNRWDEGEIYGDLMFRASDSGWIDQYWPLRPLSGSLVLGKSSDALRDRNTIAYLPNSYIYLSGVYVPELVIRYYPEDKDMTTTLISVNDQKIYLGLISQAQDGWIEISVPGGNTIVYAEKIEVLQERKMQNTGKEIPLAEIEILNADLPETFGQWAAPSSSDYSQDGLLAWPDLKTVGGVNENAALFAEDTDLETSLTDLAIAQNGRTGNKHLISIFIIAGIALCAGIALFVIKAHKKVQSGKSANSKNTQQSIKDSDKIHYCTECGAENKLENTYCEQCGKKLPT